ncbi:MAG: carboxypeptidase regulatory-like domain-containing protein [Acidobacteriota bacterium]
MIWIKRSAVVFSLAAILLSAACSKSETSTTNSISPGESGSVATEAATAAPITIDPNAATVAGTVKLEGTPPAMAPIPMAGDPYCQQAHPQPVLSDEVAVGPGGALANVFVYVKDFKGNAVPPQTPAVLEQQGCMYHPHVMGVQVGQKFEVKNSDSTLHNVHAMAETNKSFNIGQPVPMTSERTFSVPEVMVRVKCDVHPWMHAWVGVLPHPYFAVSSGTGEFTIHNLPPGTYTIEAWHEKYGTQSQQVTVGAKESKAVSFTFKAS